MDTMGAGWRGFFLTVWSCVAVCLSFSSCGNRVLPPGGPVDRFPPRIVSIEPESNRVNVNPRTTIRIGFDEEIMPSKGRELIRLQPRHRNLEKKYRRDAIEIRAPGGLFPECTYHVEMSGDIVDLRGNTLGRPLDFFFSTGDSIHGGVVTGTLDFPDDLTGTMIFQATRLPDSLVYRTAIGADGSFRLTHLPGGSYHFLAFVDIDRDGRYEPLTDPRVEAWRELGSEAIELELELESSKMEN